MKFLLPTFVFIAQCLSFVLGQECVCTDQVTIVQTVTQTIYSGNPTHAGTTVQSGSNNNGNGPSAVTITETLAVSPKTVTVSIPPVTTTETVSAAVITETVTLTSVQKTTPSWTSSHLNSTFHWKSSSSRSSSPTSLLPSTTSSVSINSTVTSSASGSINSTISATSSIVTPSACHDSCASSIEASPTICSSLFLTTIFPSAVTKTLYTTAYPLNTTLSAVVSTKTDVETILSTYTQVVTTSTTYSNDVVLTSTITDSIVSAFSATGTTVITATSPALSTIIAEKRGLDSNASASACSSSNQLSSACSCAGATHSTTVLPVPTVTVTSVLNGTFTFFNNLTTTTQTKTSETLTSTSDVGYLSISDITTTLDVTATTTIDVAATSTFTPLPSSTGDAFCENGSKVNGLSAPCTGGGCTTFNLRIEGATDTIYEGPILTGPQDITTASGGTHLCNGLNNGANSSPSGTGITAIASAGSLCGFDFDGTFSSSFDDFFIERIGSTAQTSNEYWGILLNYAFTPTGGCETEPGNGNSLLWAFNAFNANYFLEVEPQKATLSVGQTSVFTVYGHDGNGGSPVPVSGASFNGEISNANGQVVFVATTPGTYRVKATRSDSIRSEQAIITVTA
ncbi:hypothetical protein LSUE1_G007094 [Lachnellula suecica]|uniref:Uncharacterized protein n=1 Tax=Lachnellula suecica TaxID=602035 RepID=A0A8T9BVE4_9HELO|nr:hypothetical protein LSUE1_G007094 [Lachnellula suecica]